MTIEPIGSMMTAQAANYTPPKTEKAEVSREGTEAQQASQDVQKVDNQTLNVAKADGKEGQSEHQGNTPQENAGAANEEIRKKIEEITKSIDHSNEEAVFGIHKGTNRVTIKIVDKETKETIKELPPEKTLDMIAKLWEVAGIMVDEKR